MKLVQKKCPSCGASLSIDSHATEVTCEYCKQKLIIEREEQNKEFDSTDFCLRVSKYYDNKSRNSSKKIAIIVSIFIAVGFIAALIISVGGDIMTELEKSNKNSSSNVEKKNYVTDLSQIDKKSLELFHKETEKSLNKEKSYLPKGATETEWEYVGMYLLNSNDQNKNAYFGVNKLYDVYKKSYMVNKKTIEVYASLEYENLELSSDNIVLNSFTGKVYAPFSYIENGVGYYVKGYETSEDFYNKVLRKEQDKYTITGTSGLYLEK